MERQELLKDLVTEGVSRQTVALFRRLYSLDTFRLLLDGSPGHCVFCVVAGVHEGSCLSPLLFIFFIRDISHELASSTSHCPIVGGGKLCSLVYTDGVSVFCFLPSETQQLVDTSEAFFHRKHLTPNPQKCEFVAFTGSRTPVSEAWVVSGVGRESQFCARYLGLLYQQDGRWNEYLATTLTRCRVAVGRLKIMARTVGLGNLKYLVNLLHETVSSIYRYGQGVWGVSCAQVNKLDDLFVDFVRWVFRFPITVGKASILANFARRCAKCDALYLATVQLAKASVSRNTTWVALVEGLCAGVKTSRWFQIVRSEIEKRGLASEVFEQGVTFVEERKSYAITFAQYCFHFHCNATVGNSSDLIRRRREFGIFPFIFCTHPARSRFLLSFLLSCWRYIDGGQCQKYPKICSICDSENSSFHVLFQCLNFCMLRGEFVARTGHDFNFNVLAESDRIVCDAIVSLGVDLFEAIDELSDTSLRI